MSEISIDAKLDDREYVENNFCRECDRKLWVSKSKRLGVCGVCRNKKIGNISRYFFEKEWVDFR